MRLLVPGTQAGISLRTAATGSVASWRVLLGQASTAANAAITLQRVNIDGVVAVIGATVTSVTSNWDQSGSASAAPVRLRLSAIRSSYTDSGYSHAIYVDQLDAAGTATRLISYADTTGFIAATSALATGLPALSVLSGSAAFESMAVSGDCPVQTGPGFSTTACLSSAGQSCSWTCSSNSNATVGSTPYTSAAPYVETCSAAGTMPPTSQRFSCVIAGQVACPAGQYRSSGGGCLSCPANYVSDGVGCIACLGGSQSSSSGGFLECVLCGAGTYSPAPGSSCVQCGAGSSSSPGSTSCSLCPVGTFAAAGSPSCAECAGSITLGAASCTGPCAGDCGSQEAPSSIAVSEGDASLTVSWSVTGPNTGITSFTLTATPVQPPAAAYDTPSASTTVFEFGETALPTGAWDVSVSARLAVEV